MTDRLITPRPAATLVPVRDGPQGMEVLMLQRTHQAAFLPGGYVFPGGAVDASDADPYFQALLTSPGLHEANRLMNLDLEAGGLAFWIAAVRECFEEAGLLLVADQVGRSSLQQSQPDAERLSMLRGQLVAGDRTMADICRDLGMQPALDRLAYFGHWITPVGLPRRFDTRFFLCLAPEGQAASHDNAETIGYTWVRPTEALERYRSGELIMMFATEKTLELLSGFTDARAAMEHVRAIRSVIKHEPRVAAGSKGRRVLIAGDAAYAEVGKLDPTGKGTASCVIVPATCTSLSATVRRLTAPNPSFMTGPGTNTYLVGEGDDIAVIDPGPVLEEHVDSLLAHANGRIRWILTTHTHSDHSPASRLLKAKTGAEVLGLPAPAEGRQDQDYHPDVVLRDGQRLDLGGVTLRVIHTPGHASNHLCFLHEAEQLLFTGDHIMQGSTVVINPPDGDLREYLSSLQRLKEFDIAYLAPGHGFLMDKPHAVVDRIVAHRLARENKLIAALQGQPEASAESLLPVVYDDVAEQRYPMALRSLLAHLAKLRNEGIAVEQGGQWRLASRIP
jgi:glyoxylase-like metal-dependent hydrolase (beta-lactamase superfamily II)/8-oxo-dGTP pyrophosphatase MutT (NUDIX family)